MYTIPSNTVSIHTLSVVYSNVWRLQLTSAMSSAGACSQPCKHDSMSSIPRGVEQCCQMSVYAQHFHFTAVHQDPHTHGTSPTNDPHCLPATAHATHIRCKQPFHQEARVARKEFASKLSMSLRNDMFPLVPIFCGRHSGTCMCVPPFRPRCGRPGPRVVTSCPLVGC
jgi:hypothetical protein